MQPRVQYAMTSDGVRIAYATQGEGRPLIFLVGPGFGSHVEAANLLRSGPMRAQKEGLSKGRMLVSMDLRGQGMSEHDISEYTLDAYLRDVEAVVDRLGVDRVDLMALGSAAPIAVAYAARNPGRIEHLVLWNAFAKYRESPLEQMPFLKLLLDSDWVTFTEVVAHMALGWEDGSGASQSAALMRESLTPERFKAQLEAVGHFDVTDELPKLTCQTLVLHRRGMPGRRRVSAIAAAIPNAHMVTLEGSSPTTYMGDLEALLGAINDFLDSPPLTAQGAGAPPVPLSQATTQTGLPPQTGVTVIFFADIADSTALTERMGDAAFREGARELDGALRGVIRQNGGACIDAKTLGDGVLATFTSARQAIEAALACGAAGTSAGMPLHLGLHAGDVIREDDPGGRSNVYGGAVNIAARISGLSAPGEVLVSETVRSLARTSAGPSVEGFEDRGEHALKGVSEPVRVFRVKGASA